MFKLSEQNIRREDWQSLEPTIERWGIRDVNYQVTKSIMVNNRTKIVWICPYYKKWLNMINRCHNQRHINNSPQYRGCSIYQEWRYLSNFIKWIDSQTLCENWVDLHLDKDIIVVGNKLYSPETCALVSREVNSFVVARDGARGDYLLGVSLTKKSKKNKYVSRCNNIFTGKMERLGNFPTEIEAHLAWQSYKHKLAYQLAELQTDIRVVEALHQRYAPDKDWTKV